MFGQISHLKGPSDPHNVHIMIAGYRYEGELGPKQVRLSHISNVNSLFRNLESSADITPHASFNGIYRY